MTSRDGATDAAAFKKTNSDSPATKKCFKRSQCDRVMRKIYCPKTWYLLHNIFLEQHLEDCSVLSRELRLNGQDYYEALHTFRIPTFDFPKNHSNFLKSFAPRVYKLSQVKLAQFGHSDQNFEDFFLHRCIFHNESI